MKTIDERLSNIEGQIGGVRKMIKNNMDCVKVLTQLKAIKSAVAGVMDQLVEGQLENCLKSLKDSDKKLLIKIKKYVKNN